MMLSTRRIISAASEALSSTWRFTMKDSVMPSSAMLPTAPSDMSAGGQGRGMFHSTCHKTLKTNVYVCKIIW